MFDFTELYWHGRQMFFIARASEGNNNKEKNINVHCKNKCEIKRKEIH